MKKTLIVSVALLTTVFSSVGNLRADEGHHDSNHQNEMTEMNHSSEDHNHGTLIISEGQPVPNVDLTVYEDTMRGWNLEIKLDNFAFAPENVNQANQPNEGHAHLYVNGEKITRIYGNWYYLPELPSGSNEIKIGLNANGHESLMYQGQMIEDTEIVNVP